MILGYKCFNKDLTNRYGIKFEVGKTYNANGEIKFGTTDYRTHSHGLHMCKNIEDTFRFFDTFNEEVCICEVRGMGGKCTYNDEYNGYYDMYSVEILEIIRIINREELINMALNLNQLRVERFITNYRLSKDEIELFKEKFSYSPRVLKAIAYYQEGDIHAYRKNYVYKRSK